jgi:hypothetical protein
MKKNLPPNFYKCLFILAVFFVTISEVDAQHSVARQWNEMLLLSIRNDRARPPIHARNLFHVSAAMYDAWAAYDMTAKPWLLGDTKNGLHVPFDGVTIPGDVQAAREESISYAVYNIIKHRFQFSPGATNISAAINGLMNELGYDPAYTSIDYSNGQPAALGNYIAKSFIEFGLQDGCNETGNYGNQYYEPVNPPLIMKDPGNPFIINPNRWQPLMLETFIDQSGNEVPGGSASFIGAEWGWAIPFALKSSERTAYERDGDQYLVYHDPGPPPLIQSGGGGNSDLYKWGFTFVSKWQAHLDHSDGVMWDISPASMGNVTELPTTWEGVKAFYKENEGGDMGIGYTVNPKTGLPYEPQIVPRGDYARVLAEFWADGPDSETPPGHWFTILNHVSDHPLLEKRFNGQGEILDDLEWDIKTYFVLGGAMHDAAIAAWSVKGWYDYVRPVSAIRYMAREGQSTSSALPNYNARGIPLSEGLVEVIQAGDPLEGASGEYVGKVKLYTWRGPGFIEAPTVDEAGVGWIRAEDWWPYQRPTFVTPPFAGYVSGHSTYSRAAAEVMTLLTGDEYFPGGMGEFPAPKNNFLVFEQGPSVDIVLQWATYRDASDQCSLSRIWGGIHPPQDDIPGRIIGRKVGIDAFLHAEKHFKGLITSVDEMKKAKNSFQVFPNPIHAGQSFTINFSDPETQYEIDILNTQGRQIKKIAGSNEPLEISTQGIDSGFYFIRKISSKGTSVIKLLVL